MPSEENLVAAARTGDRDAFDQWAALHRVALLSLLRRLVGHPQDAEDLLQESLLRAFRGVGDFRGDSAPRTWLFAIATRAALDHLRSRQRWQVQTLADAKQLCLDGGEHDGVARAYEQPGAAYDFRQHVAFCFTCTGRTLDPLDHAAVVLREVMSLSNAEAAAALGVTESVLRHHLSRGRSTMAETFEGLCALVSKTGVCHQCKTLRDGAPPQQQGPEVPSLEVPGTSTQERLNARLRIIQDVDPWTGSSRALHDFMWRSLGHFHAEQRS